MMAFGFAYYQVAILEATVFFFYTQRQKGSMERDNLRFTRALFQPIELPSGTRHQLQLLENCKTIFGPELLETRDLFSLRWW